MVQFQQFNVYFQVVPFLIFRNFLKLFECCRFHRKDLEMIQPVLKMYTSKRMARARPPSLAYTSPASMQFIKDHDKDADMNFEEETHNTRSCSKIKNDKSVSEKRNAPVSRKKKVKK